MGDMEKDCPCASVIQAQNDIRQQELRVHQTDIVFEGIKVKLENIEEGMKELKTDVKIIKEKPSRKWESFISVAFNWLVVTVLAIMAAKVGLL